MKRWGLRGRVVLFSMIPTLIVIILLSAVLLGNRFQDINNAVQQQAELLIQAHGIALSQASNAAPIQQILQDALADNRVRGIAVYNQEHELVASAGSRMSSTVGTNLLPANRADWVNPISHFISNDHLRVVHPLHSLPAASNGWLEMDLSTQASVIEKYKATLTVLVFSLLALGINGLLAYILSNQIDSGLQSLMQGLNSLRQDKHMLLKEDSYGEIRRLQESFNLLAASIQQNKQELQHNVDQTTEDLRETLETIEIQNIELDLARKDALEASRIKSEFLANVSHEIRTPLNGIIGFTNLLLKGELTPSQTDYLETIQKSSESLLAIINDILDFSKIEAGKLTLDSIPLNLQTIIEDVLTMMAPMAFEKRLEQVSLFYSDVPTQIVGDPLRIKQVITNLVNNAIKFTASGEVIVRVMLDDMRDNQAIIRVSVTDTGIGLSDIQQQNIFRAFTQADSSTARQYGGTGLGLVICRYLVEQMQGQIGLESESGKGSTFWFTMQCEVRPHQEDIRFLNTQGKAKVMLYEKHPIVTHAVTNTLAKKQLQVEATDDLQQLQTWLQDNNNLENYIAVLIGISTSQPMYLDISRLYKINRLNCPLVIFGNHYDQVVIADMVGVAAIPLIHKPLNQKKMFAVLHQLVEQQNFSHPINTNITNLEQASLATTLTPAIAEIKDSHSLKVLAVDDNPANLKLLLVLLEDLGVKVTTCSSGTECLEALEKDARYDLILMDIQMPEMDGLETTLRIRKLSGNVQAIPIVAVTAHVLASEKQHLLQAGMNDYVTKPINENQLIEIIKRWTRVELSINSQEAVDMALSLSLAQGKADLAEELLGMLFASLPDDQQQIKLALEQQDYSKLLHQVHRLHGATRYTGVPRLQQAASNLEDALKREQLDQVPLLSATLLKNITEVQDWAKRHA